MENLLHQSLSKLTLKKPRSKYRYINRIGETLILPIQPRIKTEAGETEPRFGFAYDYDYKVQRIHEDPITQLSGFVQTMQRTLYALLNRNSDVGLKNMSGPVGIIHGLNIMARKDGLILFGSSPSSTST